MDNLIKLLNMINIPIWINQNNNIIFVSDNYKNTIEKEDECLHITEDTTIGYFENIKIKNNLYNKLVIPIDTKDTILGVLIKKEKSNDNQMFNLLIDSIPEMIFCKDNNLNYTIINKQCEEFYTSRGVNEIIGKTDLDFDLDREFTQTCTKHDKIVLETRKPLYIEEKVPIDENDFLVYQTIKTPIIDEDGIVKGLIGSVRDITEMKKIEEKLRILSYRDILTGLYNRTYFDEKISEIVKEKDFQVGVIVGDLNGLKIVNDIFGHLEGDKLIKKAAEILKSIADQDIYIFRWGGDEFVTLIINASEEDCQNYIDKVNKLCKEVSNYNISISQGYAMFSSKDDSIDTVLREADKMLYTNKDLNKKLVSRSMINRIMSNLNKKGIETDNHINSISNIAIRIGEAMNFNFVELERLRLLCLLHDIGKLAIDDEILLKKGKLSEEEYMIAKNHSQIGYKMANLIPEIRHIANEILHHHERWDGKGYPNGLAANEIPLLSRIINVVDSFDIMINGTIYKDKISKEDAILELKKNSGTQFDPNIVNILLQII